MPIMNDQRTTIMGLSRGNWIAITLCIVGIVGASITWTVTYGQTLKQVEVNAENIERNETAIKDMKNELISRMDKQDLVQEKRYTEINRDIKAILGALR